MAGVGFAEAAAALAAEVQAEATAAASRRRPFDASDGVEQLTDALSRDTPQDAPPAEAARHRVENFLTGRPFSEDYYRYLSTRKHLPMYANKETVVKAIMQHKVTLVVGETGSGKSTQLPQFILEALCAESTGPSRVVCTQPRRVAAMSVAQRVADELDVRVGEEVGYSVRFEARRSDATRILFATDGMLLREAMKDPLLSQYHCIIVDEAHERSVSTDLLIGLIRTSIVKRPDIRVVIMSATLDVQKFQKAFVQAVTVRVPGRMFPVRHFYTDQPVKDYVAAAVAHAWHIHVTEEPGDILAFLIGEVEIERAVMQLQNQFNKAIDNGEKIRPASIRALYGALSMDDQKRVFLPPAPGERRIIFSTNIAETSLTIDGVVYVIDSGFCKQHSYRPDFKLDCLIPTVISKAAAEQRSGRAGRTRPGKCFRLFRESDFSLLPDHTYPEIQRCNLTDVCLTMLKLGMSNIIDFPYLDIPAATTLADALTQLNYLEAVDDSMVITDFGRQMAEYPLDANTARMLLRSPRHGCSAEMAVLAAMLSVPNVFHRPPQFRAQADEMRDRISHRDGDHLSLFCVFMLYLECHKSPQFCKQHFLSLRSLAQADKVYYQILHLMTARDLPIVSCLPPGGDWRQVESSTFRKAVLEGFFTKVAFHPQGADSYVQVREPIASKIHRSSQLGKPNAPRPRWVTFHELEMTSADELPSMKCVTPVEVEWLPMASKDFFCPDEVSDVEAAMELRRAAARPQAAAQPPRHSALNTL